MLGYLRAAALLKSLPLKQLTLNLTLSHDGTAWTDIHKFDVNHIQEMDDRYRTTICENRNRVSLGDI